MSTSPAPSRTPFRQRVGYYLLGVAVGLLLTGVLLAQRQRMAAQREAEAKARQQGGAATIPSATGR
jgi:hypothetical protein